MIVDDATGKVAGFIATVSDGVLSACVPFLEVLPEYQGRGIGTLLVRRMLEKLDGLYAAGLTCNPRLQPFYARFGLQKTADMGLRNP